MAGVLNVDTLKSDSNLKLQIASANVAFIDSTGLNIVGGNLIIAGSTVSSAGLNSFNANGTISASSIASVNANTITSGTIPVARVPQLTSAKMPTGSILQVVQTAYATEESTTTVGAAAFQSSGCTASITPSSSSNKILVMLSMPVCHINAGAQAFGRIMRGSSAAFSGVAQDFWASDGSTISGNINIQWLDSPSTTSSTTYTAQFATTNSGKTIMLNRDYNGVNNGVTYLTLMEVAA